MIRRLAPGILVANALVLVLATASIAAQHDAPPGSVAPTPAQILAAPITVSTPGDVQAPTLTRVSVVRPLPLPRSMRLNPMPIARSGTTVFAESVKKAKPRLRTDTEKKTSNDLPELQGSIALTDESGGRGFL